MHELSLVMSIIGIAEDEAQKNNASSIEEIELDIGELSGVEITAFDFAWNQAVKSTILEKAKRTINHIPGEGKCQDCGEVFPIHQYFDPCPVCHEHLIHIKTGKEFRVRSLVVN
jgi:hydrogenase nickel incorporation protein HypA/HybF